jgi:hypothetical protein
MAKAAVANDKFGKIMILSSFCFQPNELLWRRLQLLANIRCFKEGLMAAMMRLALRFVTVCLAAFTKTTRAQGNPASAAESGIVAKLQRIARKNISDNRSNLSDGTDFFCAAPGLATAECRKHCA